MGYYDDASGQYIEEDGDTGYGNQDLGNEVELTSSPYTPEEMTTALDGTGYHVNSDGVVIDAAGVPPDASMLDKLKKLLEDKGMSKASDALRATGKAIGAATTASLNNDQENATALMKQQEFNADALMRSQSLNQTAGLTANGQNIAGQNAFESALMKRADVEKGQRSEGLKNIYRSSFAQNFKGSPYNVNGPTSYSPEYLGALKMLEGQGTEQLSKSPTYDVNKLAALTPPTAYTPERVSTPRPVDDPSVRPSTLQTVGNWLSPALTAVGAATAPTSAYDQFAKWLQSQQGGR